jgi:hypothetical protein
MNVGLADTATTNGDTKKLLTHLDPKGANVTNDQFWRKKVFGGSDLLFSAGISDTVPRKFFIATYRQVATRIPLIKNTTSGLQKFRTKFMYILGI